MLVHGVRKEVYRSQSVCGREMTVWKAPPQMWTVAAVDVALMLMPPVGVQETDVEAGEQERVAEKSVVSIGQYWSFVVVGAYTFVSQHRTG